MSLFSALQTSVSGMAAQSNALSAISDNIANSSTDGYKEASAEFETLLGSETTGSYSSGGVITDIRYGVADQGTLATTTSATDLAINGSGFFAVSNSSGAVSLTRAGSFLPNSDGDLVNTSGFNLMGYKVNSDGTTSSDLSVINVASNGLQATASTSGSIVANLPSTATAVASDLPSTTNSAATTYTDKTSLTLYDGQGTAINLDVYATKTGPDTWEVTAYNAAGAASGGGFPYSSGNVGSVNLTFGSTGNITSTPSSLNVQIGGNSVPIDLSGMTQLATSFGVTTASANGNAPSALANVTIGQDGTLSEVFANGTSIPTYKIPLATVTSPDNLTPETGNVYVTNALSGNMVLSTAGTNGTGSIASDSLEQSTVDLATELTNMIVAQRGYEANSKVLQASSDLLGVLNRLTTS